jgi:hypothetical protein
LHLIGPSLKIALQLQERHPGQPQQSTEAEPASGPVTPGSRSLFKLLVFLLSAYTLGHG